VQNFFFFSRAKFFNSLRTFCLQKWDFSPKHWQKSGNFFQNQFGEFFQHTLGKFSVKTPALLLIVKNADFYAKTSFG